MTAKNAETSRLDAAGSTEGVTDGALERMNRQLALAKDGGKGGQFAGKDPRAKAQDSGFRAGGDAATSRIPHFAS